MTQMPSLTSVHDDGSAVPSARYLSMNSMTRRQLEAAMRAGMQPALADLVGWEFRGMNLPRWARLVGIKKFIKGFYRPVASAGEVYGYNRPVVQNKLHEPWRPRRQKNSPGDPEAAPFGFFQVYPVDATATDNDYLNAVLLDYGRGSNPSFDPSRTLRDYLVQLDVDNPDVFLGKAYVALGSARPAVSFFVLERMRRVPVNPGF